MKKNETPLFSFLLLIVLLGSAVLLAPLSTEAGWVGTPAPEFTLNDTNGKAVSLNQFKGRVVFINFWASWCAPCKKELPSLISFVNKLNASDIVVLAINIDKKRSHAEGFLKGIKPLPENLIVLFDPKSTVIPKYRAMAMPTSFIIGRDGAIRYVHFGYNKEDPAKWVIEADTLIKEQTK